MTVLETIFAEVDTRLGVVATAVSGRYERMPSGDADVFPALEAYDLGDEPDEEPETDTERLSLQLTVAGLVENYGGAAAHNQMIDLHARAVKALTGDDGRNLGGLVESIRIVGRRRVDVAELASVRRLGFEQDFLIIYSTALGDPSQVP